jgi:sugar lactone lactonase YvrE
MIGRVEQFDARLHDHPSTKAEPGYLPLVRGEPLMSRPPNGRPSPLKLGSDGIAIGADGARLYYCPLAGRRLYSVSIDALVDREASDDRVAATVVDEGDKGGGADGLQSDAAHNLYTTNYEHHAILRRSPEGLYTTLVHDPRLMWPDTLCVATDGYLYVTANGFDGQTRFHAGRDVRRKPYSLFRVRTDAQPVLLR